VIGLDTNILVRYLTQDDAAQARKVDALIGSAVDEETRLHVDDIVLCELVWVLRGAYRLGKPAIVGTLDKLMSTSAFSFEDRELLQGALADYAGGTGDFSDYVIGRRNARAGCEHTATLDRQLRAQRRFHVL
jgi:predicted nucleic-acid-binding protein